MARSRKLYRLGANRYVQHNGSGPLPDEVHRYAIGHKGETPPYIPLPDGETTFQLGEEGYPGRQIQWDGKGELPMAILDFVRENGVLPPQSIRSFVGG